MTLLAVLLGAAFIALGIRMLGLPEGVAKWAPALASLAFLGGLYLSTRGRDQDAPAPRLRSGRAEDRRAGGRGQQGQRRRPSARPQPAAARRAR